MESTSQPVHLRRAEENVADIDALHHLLSATGRGGGRIEIDSLLTDLNRQGRAACAPGRAVDATIAFDDADTGDPRWWPQGVTTSADASADERIAGRRIVAVAWYAKEHPDDPEDLAGGQGVRITLLDLDTLRYRHVLLVLPETIEGELTLRPLRVHAGGIVWCGPYLHIAATARGFFTCRTEDLMRVPDDLRGAADTVGIEDGRVSTAGYRYVLPVRFAYRAFARDGEEKLRYSFLSLDRASDPPQIVAGEYARGSRTRRLARYDLDPETLLLSTGADDEAHPVSLGQGVAQMQGAVIARGRWFVTVSQGPWTPGSVYVGSPGALTRHRFATPMGPEDISYWPSTDRLWSVTEHPGRRWIFSMKRSWFD